MSSATASHGGDKPKAAEEPKRWGALPRPALVLDLLRREEGATLAELIAATGWLPHTTRATLTGLKKKAHVIERGKRGDTPAAISCVPHDREPSKYGRSLR